MRRARQSPEGSGMAAMGLYLKPLSRTAGSFRKATGGHALKRNFPPDTEQKVFFHKAWTVFKHFQMQGTFL